jgi:uncharacterized BrkB/YihY/UPF0761 family membrane protein
MRWKLIILSSLIVSFVSASTWFALTRLVFQRELFLPGNWLYLQAFVLVLIISAISIYIYRHTSQRRKTQALLSSVFTFFLILAFLSAFSYCLDLIARNSP